MSGRQSPSVVQGAGKQVMVTVTVVSVVPVVPVVPVATVVPVVPVATGVGQSAPFGQAGVVGGGAVEVWQVNPDGQSVLAAQVCARAAVGMARMAKITTIEPIQARGLFVDMVSPVEPQCSG